MSPALWLCVDRLLASWLLLIFVRSPLIHVLYDKRHSSPHQRHANMKDRVLSVLSLAVAVAALGHSFWLQHRAAADADEALRRREAELVRAAAPKVSQVCQDMLGLSFQPATFHPTTLEELARPLEVIVTRMSTPTDEPQPAPK
jgi:hypothetical protein